MRVVERNLLHEEGYFDPTTLAAHRSHKFLSPLLFRSCLRVSHPLFSAFVNSPSINILSFKFFWIPSSSSPPSPRRRLVARLLLPYLAFASLSNNLLPLLLSFLRGEVREVKMRNKLKREGCERNRKSPPLQRGFFFFYLICKLLQRSLLIRNNSAAAGKGRATSKDNVAQQKPLPLVRSFVCVCVFNGCWIAPTTQTYNTYFCSFMVTVFLSLP